MYDLQQIARRRQQPASGLIREALAAYVADHRRRAATDNPLLAIAGLGESAETLNESLIVPQVILPETTYLIAKYQGSPVMRTFVKRLLSPAWQLEPWQSADLARASELLGRYADLDLDFADACIVALAERLNVRRLLTLDRRHFSAVRPRHCSAFVVLPQ